MAFTIACRGVPGVTSRVHRAVLSPSRSSVRATARPATDVLCAMYAQRIKVQSEIDKRKHHNHLEPSRATKASRHRVYIPFVFFVSFGEPIINACGHAHRVMAALHAFHRHDVAAAAVPRAAGARLNAAG